MKITSPIPARCQPVRRSRSGFMVIAMMVILAMMLIYVAATTRLLGHLRQDLKLVEQKQVQRLEKSSPALTTNAPTAAVSSAQ